MPKFCCSETTKLVNLKNRHHKISVGSKGVGTHTVPPPPLYTSLVALVYHLLMTNGTCPTHCSRLLRAYITNIVLSCRIVDPGSKTHVCVVGITRKLQHIFVSIILNGKLKYNNVAWNKSEAGWVIFSLTLAPHSSLGGIYEDRTYVWDTWCRLAAQVFQKFECC